MGGYRGFHINDNPSLTGLTIWKMASDLQNSKKKCQVRTVIKNIVCFSEFLSRSSLKGIHLHLQWQQVVLELLNQNLKIWGMCLLQNLSASKKVQVFSTGRWGPLTKIKLKIAVIRHELSKKSIPDSKGKRVIKILVKIIQRLDAGWLRD